MSHLTLLRVSPLQATAYTSYDLCLNVKEGGRTIKYRSIAIDASLCLEYIQEAIDL